MPEPQPQPPSRAIPRWRGGLPSRWRGSLLLRLTLVALLAVVAATSATTWLLVRDAERETEARSRQLALQDAVRGAGVLSRRLIERQRSLQVAAASLAEASAGELGRWDASPRATPGLHVLFDRLFLVDPAGQPLARPVPASTDPAAQALDRQPDFLTAVQEARPMIWPVHPPASQGRAAEVVLAQPVMQGKRVRAVLAGVLPLGESGLLREVAEVGPDLGEGPSSRLLGVTDGRGRLLAAGQTSAQMPAALRDRSLALALSRWRSEGSPVEPEGLVWSAGDLLLVGAGIAGPDWVVWRAYSRASMLAPLDALRSRSMHWALGVALGLAALLLLYLGWQLSPLAQLERRVMALLDGDQKPEADWPVARGEIGALSATLRGVALALARKDGENRALLEQLEGVMAAAPLGLGFLQDDRLTLVNAELARLLGYAPEELRGLSPRLLLPKPADWQPLREQVLAAFAAGRPYAGEHQCLRRQGTVFWGQLHAREVRPGLPAAGIVLTLSDISHQVTSRHQLEWSASHDALTGLLNRRAFLARLEHFVQIQPRRAGALLVIDLDHFKPVNDTEGHQAGDAVLQAVARVLREGVRQSDAVGRLGGDEFAVLLEGCPPEWARRQGQKLLQALQDLSVGWGTRQLRIGASIGLAPWQDHLGHARAWLHKADMACYEAKRSGRAAVREYVPPPDEARAG